MRVLARTAAVAVVVAAGLVRGVEVPQCCAPGVSPDCTEGKTVHRGAPSIAGSGAPSSLAARGFEILVSNVPGERYGTLFHGFYAASVP